MRRGFDRRDGNAVLRGKILERFHLRIVGVQLHRLFVDRSQEFDVEPTSRAVPDNEKRRNASARQMKLSRQQAVRHQRRAAHIGEGDRDRMPLLGGIFFDQPLFLHHVQGQIAETELPGDRQLRHLGAGDG